jgi:glucosylceramidase
MKTKHQMDGSLHPGLNSTCHDVWARYMSRVITEYKKLGMNVWGITVQNEPENAASWEACCYSAEEERDFVRDFFGPRLRDDHPDVKIMIYDHNKDDVATFADTMYADPEAAKFMDGTAFHWYSGPEFDNLEKAYAADPSKFMLATEACNCPGVKIDDWSRGENYGYDILGDLRHHSVGWVDWNMVLNEIGGPNHVSNYCDSPIIAFAGNNTYHLQPPYFYMGHVSKFVLPDSVVVGVKESGLMASEMSSVAVVREDGKIVVVVMNKNDDSVPFKIKLGSEALRCNIPPHSMQTYVI